VKPKHAIKHLRFLVDSQQTISTNRLEKITHKLASHQKMLETDNKRLRERIKDLRKSNKRLRSGLNE